MRKIPSMKTLEATLSGVLSKGHMPVDEALRELRKILVAWRDGTIPSTPLSKPSRTMMQRVDEILEGYGIEGLESVNGRAHAYYVNMGDTYAPTILLDTSSDSVRVTSWGDWVEAQERKGNRFE